ncbi:MAG: hypothetical protein HY905_26875 [Deltaproteobacteria bacterium]|nr:hypothetical protein [Deltaproteobacteria bacterium]
MEVCPATRVHCMDPGFRDAGIAKRCVSDRSGEAQPRMAVGPPGGQPAGPRRHGSCRVPGAADKAIPNVALPDGVVPMLPAAPAEARVSRDADGVPRRAFTVRFRCVTKDRGPSLQRTGHPMAEDRTSDGLSVWKVAES